MRQGCARGCRVRPWIGLLLTLLMMPPLAAAEEAPFAVAVAGAKDARALGRSRWWRRWKRRLSPSQVRVPRTQGTGRSR
jgi:hypothetical protein